MIVAILDRVVGFPDVVQAKSAWGSVRIVPDFMAYSIDLWPR